MRWISRFLTSEEGDPVDPDETIINDAPYDAHKAIGSSPATTAAPGDRQGAPITEEIKQRQMALAVRYVAAVRLGRPRI
jgi:hypothetical protein